MPTPDDMRDKRQQKDASPAASDAELVSQSELVKGTSLWADAWRRLLKNKAAVTGIVIVVVMMVACAAAPLIAEYVTHFAFDEQHRVGGAKPPGSRSVPWHPKS